MQSVQQVHDSLRQFQSSASLGHAEEMDQHKPQQSMKVQCCWAGSFVALCWTLLGRCCAALSQRCLRCESWSFFECARRVSESDLDYKSFTCSACRPSSQRLGPLCKPLAKRLHHTSYILSKLDTIHGHCAKDCQHGGRFLTSPSEHLMEDACLN